MSNLTNERWREVKFFVSFLCSFAVSLFSEVTYQSVLTLSSFVLRVVVTVAVMSGAPTVRLKVTWFWTVISLSHVSFGLIYSLYGYVVWLSILVWWNVESGGGEALAFSSLPSLMNGFCDLQVVLCCMCSSFFLSFLRLSYDSIMFLRRCLIQPCFDIDKHKTNTNTKQTHKHSHI